MLWLLDSFDLPSYNWELIKIYTMMMGLARVSKAKKQHSVNIEHRLKSKLAWPVVKKVWH